jgi:hypothetical protein
VERRVLQHGSQQGNKTDPKGWNHSHVPLQFRKQPSADADRMQQFNPPSKFVGLTYEDGQTLGNMTHLIAFLKNVAGETARNQNCMSAEKELLLWHQLLGHANFQQIQQVLSQPRGKDLKQVLVLPKMQASSACSRPLCAGCMPVGKADSAR